MRRPERERGATMVLVGLMATVLMFIAALVVDFGLLRVDRSSNQVSADTAATAAASSLATDGGAVACQAAVGYLAERLGAATVSGIDCTQFPVSCDASTPAVSELATSGQITVELVHPVDDTDPLMDASAINANQPVVAADGDRCDRFGVEVSEEQPALFSGIGGATSNRTSVHAVARPVVLPEGTLPINLLLLERHECGVLSIGGGGSSSGIIVREVEDPVTGETRPGTISVDSDGTVGCGPNGTIDADGSGATIRADGPAGCSGELMAGTGQGCGNIDVIAPGPPGCLLPACSSSGVVAPAPRQVTEPLTRAAIDWEFNCKASYPVSYDIGSCDSHGTQPPYIDQLVAAVGAPTLPSGFQSYQAAGFPCGNIGPHDVIVVPQGNWRVDCDINVKGSLTFLGGNVVADGDIEVSGILELNQANSQSYGSWSDGDNFEPTASSPLAAYLYMRDGTFSKGAQGSITMLGVSVYLSATSDLGLGGGSNPLVWTAPLEGPFENLALWSESVIDHTFKGGSTLDLEGVFFAPLATIVYTGSGSQNQVAAQFISRKLSVQGNGQLEIKPTGSRSVAFPARIASLIR